MSEKQKTQLNEGQGEQSTDSVFDFLYYDAPRIASFLSQFDSSGHLTEIVTGERAQRSKQITTTAEASGSVPLVANARGAHTRDVRAEYEKDNQRVYDPAWTNARAFLDYLSERDLIQRDISAAGIGQFVLSVGELAISDLQLMHKTWQLPSVKKQARMGTQIATGNRHQKRRAAAIGQESPIADGLDLFWDMITVLPHTIQARLRGAAEVWCNLNQQGLSTDSSDITLKHGVNIPGSWALLGVLDARPDGTDAEEDVDVDFGDGAEMAVKMMGIIAPIAKNLLGRPARCYGVTPLLIFREIAG